MTPTELLARSRTGGAILFCGAGFTADCLGFETPDTLGVGSHLLRLLNIELAERGHAGTFRQLPSAATRFIEIAGEIGLMDLLKNRFRVSHVTQDMVNILRYPWHRVYTTNYDNGVELACGRIPKKFHSKNNTDDPRESFKDLEIVHLHGYTESWNIRNFRESCILDVNSYVRLPSLTPWLEQLRIDLERASTVVFAGFSASDFHLNQVFFNASDLRSKAIFVNRMTPERDEDEYVVQEQYGRPVYVGLGGLAAFVNEAIVSPVPPALRLASFQPFAPSEPAQNLPSVASIQDLLTMGVIEHRQTARDQSLARSDYHVLRSALTWFDEQTKAGKRVFLLSGEVCDGKSLVVEDLAQRLSASRPVYWLRVAYDDVLDEVARILERHQDVVLVVENCFELRTERLSMLGKAFEGGNGTLLLTARSIAADAETGKVRSLKPLSAFAEFRLSSLSDEEIEKLERLIDQFGGFAHLGGRSAEERRRYIRDRCGRSLPAVLLDILSSPYVKERYREQINCLSDVGAAANSVLISSLFLKHIGDPPPASFLANIFSIDVSDTIRRANLGNGGFQLLRVERGTVQTVPAIGASLILREFFADDQIVTAVVRMLEEMARRDMNATEYERYSFGQMMRYSRLSTVVNDPTQVERFFDHISKIDYFRQQPLFWLQWHMANAAVGRYADAERLLERGYAEAENWEKRRGSVYNRRQLDDRKAKFLTQRVVNTPRSPTDVFRDLKASAEIVGRLLRDQEVTHHPFETFLQVVEAVAIKGDHLQREHMGLLFGLLQDLATRSARRVAEVAEGYQRTAASRSFENAMNRLSSISR